MPGHSRSKNGALSHAYVPGIHVLAAMRRKTWMASEVGLARPPRKKLAASRVNPTCDDKPGHDE
jgi:hypothetical protein